MLRACTSTCMSTIMRTHEGITRKSFTIQPLHGSYIPFYMHARLWHWRQLFEISVNLLVCARGGWQRGYRALEHRLIGTIKYL